MLAKAAAVLVGASVAGYCVLPDIMERHSPSSIRHAPDPINSVALTFDDGPHPMITPAVLDALAAVNGHATFFLVGRNVVRYPDLARQIVAQGHAIGVHTQSHPHAWLCTPARMRQEIGAGFNAIVESTGKRPLWFRPPYGAFNALTRPTANQLGLRIALWSCDAGDWLPGATAEGIRSRVQRGIRPGAIIDLHDGGRTPLGCSRMADVLPEILQYARAQGLQPVQLGSFFGWPPYA